jgi:hypothetical protein
MKEMSEAKLTVDAGVCRFKTKIHAIGADDYMTIALVIESECPNVKNLGNALKVVDTMDVTANCILQNCVMIACNEHIPHAACPVPCAIVKACEVASDAALKKTVTISFE